MADIAQIPPTQEVNVPLSPPTNDTPSPPRPLRTSGPSKHQLNLLYSLPAPIRTFPLPTLVPHNPLSLLHIFYVWISQTVSPPISHFDPLYQGWYSPETRSVHITDARSIRGLWEQGFYGKGTLSRSEPNWMAKEEKNRRGTKARSTAEELTRQRRAERQQAKWERARKEREAIDQKRLEEAEATLVEYGADENSSTSTLIEETSSPILTGAEGSPLVQKSKYFLSPVGPLELLSLPNSVVDLELFLDGSSDLLLEAPILSSTQSETTRKIYAAPVGPLEILVLPNSAELSIPIGISMLESNDHVEVLAADRLINGHSQAEETTKNPTFIDLKVNGNRSALSHSIAHSNLEDTTLIESLDSNDEAINGSTRSDESETGKPNGSALVDGAPSTPKIKRQKSVRFSPTVEKNTFIQSEPPSPERATMPTVVEEESLVIIDQEHLQLTLEEAFFLSYALGALSILDSTTNLPIPNQSLFPLFRKISYFPPLSNPILSPDDPFMINYVVYHYFRSLGWVPRSGIKFSVDFMLYNRGPVFTHSEFAVIVLPSYTDPYWSSNAFLQNYVKGKEKRTWAWLSCINRVITQVKKTLILAYVDIPKPLNKEEEGRLGVHGALERYRVKEITMKRWLANRSRD